MANSLKTPGLVLQPVHTRDARAGQTNGQAGFVQRLDIKYANVATCPGCCRIQVGVEEEVHFDRAPSENRVILVERMRTPFEAQPMIEVGGHGDGTARK